jgi:hypothetical protein
MKIQTGKESDYQTYVTNNSKDAYSKGVVDYGEAWAALMEAKIEAGASVADCANTASHEADTDGITGFMYGCAVKALAHFWIHGEELRQWHNRDAQIGTEGDEANKSGGVLNPALLTITQKQK